MAIIHQKWLRTKNMKQQIYKKNLNATKITTPQKKRNSRTQSSIPINQKANHYTNLEKQNKAAQHSALKNVLKLKGPRIRNH
jgi:hypothetical protein